MPIFGQSLGVVVQNTGFVVPDFLEDCFKFVIEKSETEGIFRIPGDRREVNNMINTINATGSLDIKPETTVFVICNIISGFIKQIPDHLLNDKNCKKWEGPMSVDQVKKEVKNLPVLNQVFLARMFAFFITIAKNQEKSKMTPENLARILSGSLIENKDNPYWFLDKAITLCFFEHYDEIFSKFSGFDADHQFLSPKKFRELTAEVMQAFFCQSCVYPKPVNPEVLVQKQNKMCRNIQIKNLSWKRMFDVLLHSDTSA